MTGESRRNRGGQIIVLFVVALVVLAVICVFAVDVGYLFLARAELQNAADAAALAGASQLTIGMTEQETQMASQEARALAQANRVAGTPLHLADQDIQFGHYDSQTCSFVPEPQAPGIDSVMVTGRRTAGSPDGPVGLFFGPVFGWRQQEFGNVVAVATKPWRYVMLVLDRSGSMCYDTSGVSEKYSPEQNATGYYALKSPSGWYALPQRMYSGGWLTAYFYALDDNTGQVRTEFLSDAIRSTLVSGKYWAYRTPEGLSNNPSWIKAPSDVTIYSRYLTSDWSAYNYYSVPGACDYATAGGPAQPIQSVMDAACAFVDLLRAQDDTAGFVTYASRASTDSILTSDFTVLKSKLQSFYPCGSTAEPEGMKAALDELILSGRTERYGQRIMILLTDGNANMLNGTDYGNETRTYNFLGESVTTSIHPTVAAAMEQQTLRAVAGRVRIYCVSFGTSVDTAVHRQIARKTNGAYYYSADHQDLTDIFVDIFRRLPPILTK